MLAHTNICRWMLNPKINEYHKKIRDKENEKNFINSKQTLMVLLNKKLGSSYEEL